jgi:hypothetical protein
MFHWVDRNGDLAETDALTTGYVEDWPARIDGETAIELIEERIERIEERLNELADQVG